MENEFYNPIKEGRSAKFKQKASITTDMNAMVDLAFLLLTFFMLTTTMVKPKVIELVMPVPDDEDTEETVVQTIRESRALTIMALPDNELYYYTGFSEEEAIDTAYGPDGIRSVLIDHNESQDDPIVIIKAHPESIFENIIDLIDEMNITRMERYAFDEFGDKEFELLSDIGVNL